MNIQKWVDYILLDVTAFGGPFFFGLFGLFSLVIQEYRIFWIFVGMCIVHILVISGVRTVCFKERPLKQKYSNWFEKIDAASFPSAHAVRVGILVTFLYILLHFSLWLVILLLGLIVLYSRVHFLKHYPVDVFAGAVIGVVIGYAGILFL